MSLLAVERPVAPRFRTGPRARSTSGPEAVELAASAGLVAMDYQAADLDGWLGERSDGKWAASQVVDITPRQNGKGGKIEKRELAGLFLFEEELILHTAHEFKTAVEAFRRLWSLIEPNPDLFRRVRSVNSNNNGYQIELHTGQRCRFLARSKSSGRGFSADTLILDESYNLTDDTLAAILPTLSARPNPQVIYTSSHPHPDDGTTKGRESAVLRRLMREGRAGAPGMFYVEYSALPEEPLEGPELWAWVEENHRDPAVWHRANPGMRHDRPAEEFVATVELPSMSMEDFARERLGIVNIEERTEADERPTVFDQADWAACASDEPTGSPVVFAVDVAPFGTSAAIAASDGVHVQVVEHRPGADWVVDRLVELNEAWKPARIVGDEKGALSALAEDLAVADLEVEPLKFGDVTAACASLLQLVQERRLRHRDDPRLNEAQAGAAKRTAGAGEAWLWSRKDSRADICPLVAVTYARASIDPDAGKEPGLW